MFDGQSHKIVDVGVEEMVAIDSEFEQNLVCSLGVFGNFDELWYHLEHAGTELLVAEDVVYKSNAISQSI